jgi:hypothetical protein
MLRSLSLLAAGLFFAQISQAQLSRLFYPNITLRAEYMPSVGMDNKQNYGLTRTTFFGMTPINSGVQVGYSLRKKFDIQANHLLMVAKYTQINPTINDKQTPAEGYKSAMVGAVLLHASFKDRLWIYGGGLGVTETNETFFTPQPFLWGGALRMHIMGLQTQVVYGSAVVYNQKFMIIPIVGVNKKINDHWRATALLPFFINFNYHPAGWLHFDTKIAVDGYSGGFQQIGATEKLLRRSNYQDVRLSLSANAHLFTVFNVSLEGGLAGFRQLKTFNSARENLSATTPGLVPFVGVSVRYVSSRSQVSSAFTRKLNLGGGSGAGVNW